MCYLRLLLLMWYMCPYTTTYTYVYTSVLSTPPLINVVYVPLRYGMCTGILVCC
jgi:hypothetical protein